MSDETNESAYNRGMAEGLRMASEAVAAHWNDRHTMVNQFDQAQRSSMVIARMVVALKDKFNIK